MNAGKIHYVSGKFPMELMEAEFDTHEFPRHYHDTYLIEVVMQGADAFQCGDKEFVAEPGSVIFVHPGEVHTGRSVGEQPLKYVAFYPGLEAMAAISAAFGLGQDAPQFVATLVNDPELSAQLREAFANAASGAPTEGSEAIGSAIALAVVRYGSAAEVSERESHDAVQRVLDRVSDEPERNWSLEELAGICAYSPFYLIRLFRRAVGMSPHEYLQAFRAEQARKLLRQGCRSSEAARRLGYADQAHFTRVFRKITGTTPGAFRKPTSSES